MKSHPRTISFLQRALNHEFYAAQQYTLQAALAESWGMKAFARELREGVVEETRHAEMFITQMLSLGATPHAGLSKVPQIGRSYEDMLRIGIATEWDAICLYRDACIFCERIGDTASQHVFATILRDEQEHHDALVQQLDRLGNKRA